MAVLTNPFNIKKNGTVYACKCYTTTAEATPTTITGGSYWEIKNNNTVCYIGLYPTSVSGGSYHTPLKIKKNNVEYYVETQVVNTYTVTITQSANQTIKVTCNGSTYTSTFTAPVGASYTVTVTPATGYTAGTPSSSSGYVNSNITISANSATKKTYTVTITQTTGQTITVTCGGKDYTGNFTANHGDTWTAKLTASTGYNVGTLEATSGTITGATTIKAKTNATLKKFTVTITQSANQTIKVTCGGTTYTSSFTANYGSTYTVTVTPATDYKAGTPNVTSGTVTANVSISATSAILDVHADGTLLYQGYIVWSTSFSFTTPNKCKYVSIAYEYWASDKWDEWWNVVVKRVPVTPNTTYTIPSKSGDGWVDVTQNTNNLVCACYNSWGGADWGYYTYNHPTLGVIPKASGSEMRIYTDDGQGVVYADSYIKQCYKDITGEDYPS